MKARTWVILLTLFAVLVSACGGAATPTPTSGQRPAATATSATSGATSAASGAAAASPSAASAGTTPTAKGGTARLAMIMPGTIEDADYNFVGYQALQDLHRTLGIDVAYQERVAPADAERVARGFINDGYTIIAFHGGQFVTTVQSLAPQFPNVTFIMESAGPTQNLPPNVWNIGRRFFEGFYALGALGALATKSNKVGIVLGVQLPDFIAAINAIKQAVQENNPKATVVYTFVGDQNDPVKARQAAEAQVNDGVDFIIMVVNLGAQGVIEAVKGKPVLITTYYTDKYNQAPQNMAASLLTDFSTPYANVVKNILAGKRSGYEEMRPGNGMSLSPIHNVSPDVAAKVQDIFQKVASKQIQVPEVLQLPK